MGASEEEDEEEMEMEVKDEEEGVGGGDRGFCRQEDEEKMGARRSRPKEEKERTKLRERNRRAITAGILAGLRKHGNYNLRVRADINDVIAALAKEAGWVVLPDGTTFPSQQVCSLSSSSFSSS